jgi:hypothetical protein
MQYLLLIYANEADTAARNEASITDITKEYFTLTKGIMESGHYVGGNRLDSTAKATTVRIRDNKKLVTDGPFAETKEQLGGYYLVEAADLDEALAIAARIPGARMGSVEVRPIVPVTLPV